VEKRCSYCGLPVNGRADCPLCGKAVGTVNLRRTLLVALVVEVYLVTLVAILRVH
jgi:transposase